MATLRTRVQFGSAQAQARWNGMRLHLSSLVRSRDSVRRMMPPGATALEWVEGLVNADEALMSDTCRSLPAARPATPTEPHNEPVS